MICYLTLVEGDDVPSLAQQARDLKNLSFELKEFKGTVAKRNLQDAYRFAEIAEYEDYKLNVANSCRVMVTGIQLWYLDSTIQIL